MCGIAGIFGSAGAAGPVDESALARMGERMRARGPDGEGAWIDQQARCGLVHRRLAIIDTTDAGAQPMHDPLTGARIVFNGEIYNYQALRRDLASRGCRFQSGSDTEVILALYREHGRGMLPMLRGMFALAIHDPRQQGLLLARDVLGIKPLYVADNGIELRFASQVKALLAGGGVDDSPDPAGEVGFLLWGHVPEPFTLYRGVRALAPGTSLWVAASGERDLRRFADALAPLRESSAEGSRATTDLRGALLDSVRHHLVADVPVGVFLSAGIDSASVLGLAAECSGTPLTALTIGFAEFAGTEMDERPLARRIARHFGVNHVEREISRADFALAHDRLLDAMDQPSIDGVNSYMVCQAARDAGFKAVLSGLGGDELLHGYSTFRRVPRLARVAGPFSRVPAAGRLFRRLALACLPAGVSPKVAGLLELGGRIPSAYLLDRGLFMPWEIAGLMDPDRFRAGWTGLATLPWLEGLVAGIASPAAQVAALELSAYMRNQLLRDADWSSMAHSVELRVPLVDAQLHRQVAQLRSVPSKRDLGSSVRPLLPQEILSRRKTGFGVPMRSWLSGDSAAPGQGGSASRQWARQLHAKFTGQALGGHGA